MKNEIQKYLLKDIAAIIAGQSPESKYYNTNGEGIPFFQGKADFGVYDISHAKLSAKDLGISYEEYVERLGNKEKVKILHVSGNIDDTGKYEYKPDKHVLINEKEISDVIKLFEQFKNVDLVVSEYAYNTKYSYEKEIVIEVMILNEIIKTKNEQEIRNKLKFLQENLENNLSNLEEIIVLNY